MRHYPQYFYSKKKLAHRTLIGNYFPKTKIIMRQLLPLLLLAPAILALPPTPVIQPRLTILPTATTECRPPLGTETVLCSGSALDLWTIDETQPDTVFRGGQNAIGGTYHIKQTVDACGSKDRHGHHQHQRVKDRIYTVGWSVTMGMGAKGCDFWWLIASNATDLIVNGHPVLSVRPFDWPPMYSGWLPTWNNMMGKNSTIKIGKEIGKVRDIHKPDKKLIQKDSCPAGMGKPQEWNSQAYIFEMDESVKESAEVKFHTMNAACGAFTGTYFAFHC
ncbi:hypothetical protein BGZ60DRAFT_259539 [Tricladium varicosporioides]|nr:hypothetical protein BGZ60DRAFT_259539 [Hymenoscyphus varicosporioides]